MNTIPLITLQLGETDITNLIRIIDAAQIKGSEAEYVFKLRAHLFSSLPTGKTEEPKTEENKDKTE